MPSPTRNGHLQYVQALLRETAIGAVTRGWPIVPGTYPAEVGDRWYGRHGATDAPGLAPLDNQWQHHPIITWEQAHTTWSRRRYGVLLVCGRGVDVLELPMALASAALPALDTPEVAGPVVVLAPARWLLLVNSGSGLLPAMAAWPAVVHRGCGQWVPLPPTDLGHTRAGWHRAPEPGAALPGSEAVQRAIIAALGGGGSW
ncbi:MAG TPA: bifunctional DNA primase/polymerase [Pseudonocardiaceae bacterium]|jgi:hypothetical protein|nr:bifunctional DNA primase/polymerase [Pseudonocardiaceae bacterium]